MDYQSKVFIKILQEELERRKKINPSYSLRSFADYLKTSPANLSRLLNGQKTPNKEFVLQVMEILDFQFPGVQEDVSEDDIHTISAEEFKHMSSWEYAAIRQSTHLKDFKYDPEWIANKLNIEKSDVEFMLKKMVALGLLKIENDRILLTHRILHTDQSFKNSQLMKDAHVSNLERAIKAVQTYNEEKFFTHVTLASSPEKIAMAGRLITQFRKDLCRFLEDGESSEVYSMMIQVFPSKRIDD